MIATILPLNGDKCNNIFKVSVTVEPYFADWVGGTINHIKIHHQWHLYINGNIPRIYVRSRINIINELTRQI